MSDPDPLQELAALTSALRVHAELCALSGATGLERAPPAPKLTDEPPVQRAVPTANGVTARSAATNPDVTARSAATNPDVTARSAATNPDVTAPAVTSEGVGTAAPTTGWEERRTRLAVLAGEVAQCTKCVLHRERTQTVFARGTGSSGVCFVGEGPGADEDAQGFPFVGKAGQLLDRMIAAMGFDRDEVYVCNIVKCRPPKNRKPEPDEMAACRPYLAEQLALLAPKVIVAMGATAVEGLLGIGGGITRLRGTWRLYGGRIAVMPTFHPAYLLRTPEAKREVWQDLKEVLKHLGRAVPAS